MKIIPAIDIIKGNAVRLQGGDYSKMTTYSEDPVKTALAFEAIGLKNLHLVDLDGAKSGQVVNIEVLKQIKSKTNLTIDFGGGVKSTADLEKVLSAGAHQVTVGTLAVKNPMLVKNWIQKHGPDRIILGADVKDQKIAVNGWLEKSNIDLFDFLEDFITEGITNVICTDISKDGFLQGSAVELYESILKRFPTINLIASGGVSSIEELEVLKKMGCNGAIIGKAIYEGVLTLGELEEWSCFDSAQHKGFDSK